MHSNSGFFGRHACTVVAKRRKGKYIDMKHVVGERDTSTVAMGSGSSVPAFQLTAEEAEHTVKSTYDISEV